MRLPRLPSWSGGVLTTIRRKPSILVAPVLLTVLLVVGSVLGVIYGSEALENNAKNDALVSTRTTLPQPPTHPLTHPSPFPTHPLITLPQPDPCTHTPPRTHPSHPPTRVHVHCLCRISAPVPRRHLLPASRWATVASVTIEVSMSAHTHHTLELQCPPPF